MHEIDVESHLKDINNDVDALLKDIKHKELIAPPRVKIPSVIGNMSSTLIEKINHIQQFIISFEYNYTGRPFIKFSKNRGMLHVKNTAKELINLSLPIQCVEAVFIGILLTAGITGLHRIPLSFKSRLGNNTHRHLVLILHHENLWGAIGISRRNNLMYKPLIFNSLYDLIENFKDSYEMCFHRLVKIYLGPPLSHDMFCDTPIIWRSLALKYLPYDSNNITQELINFVNGNIRTKKLKPIVNNPRKSCNTNKPR